MNKEPLADSLVDNYHSDFWLTVHFAVELLNQFFELWNFKFKNLSSHGVSNSVSINNQVIRVALVVFLELLESLMEQAA